MLVSGLIQVEADYIVYIVTYMDIWSPTIGGWKWNGIFLLGLSSSLLDGEHSLASQGTSLVRGMKVLGQNPGIQTSPC